MKKLLITVNGVRYDVDVEVVEDDEATYHQTYYQPTVRSQATPSAPRPAAPSTRPVNAGSGDSKVLSSPLNGVVVDIHVVPGKKVKMNDVVMVVESMKMNTNISSPFEGVVKSVEVGKGDNIEAGMTLVIFE